MNHQAISSAEIPPDINALLKLRRQLEQEHTDFDAAAAALQSRPGPDLNSSTRFKKKKLALKDRIVAIDSQIAALRPRVMEISDATLDTLSRRLSFPVEHVPLHAVS